MESRPLRNIGPVLPFTNGPRLSSPAKPPRFGGLGDAISSGIGVIDHKRIFELGLTDFCAMVLPRATLAWLMRGNDDGRETFLRETSGLLGNVFLVGLASYGLLKFTENNITFYNPKGIPPAAWINAGSLEAFGKLYHQALQTTNDKMPGASYQKKLLETREQFIRNVLTGMESGDRQFNLAGRLASLTPAGPHDPTAPDKWKALQHVVKNTCDKPQSAAWLDEAEKAATPHDKLTHLINTLKKPENFERLTRWGRLSAQLPEFEQYFSLKNTRTPQAITGTTDFNRKARQHLEQILHQLQKTDPRFSHFTPEALQYPQAPEARQAWKDSLKAAGFDYDREFSKTRLKLSGEKLQESTNAFAEHVDKAALNAGLTDTVDLYQNNNQATRELIAGGKSRKTLLTELKHYLEQFVDRAGDEAEEKVARTPGGDWQVAIRERLFKEKKGFRHNLVPRLDDGLVTAALKSRTLYTGLPFVIAIAFGGAMTFYNNYLTKKKHGGRDFFPGEGTPPPEEAKPVGMAQAGRYPASATPPFAATSQATATNGALHRNGGAFSQFQQARQGGGGIVA
jgi:hypothetical protein